MFSALFRKHRNREPLESLSYRGAASQVDALDARLDSYYHTRIFLLVFYTFRLPCEVKSGKPNLSRRHQLHRSKVQIIFFFLDCLTPAAVRPPTSLDAGNYHECVRGIVLSSVVRKQSADGLSMMHTPYSLGKDMGHVQDLELGTRLSVVVLWH